MQAKGFNCHGPMHAGGSGRDVAPGSFDELQERGTMLPARGAKNLDQFSIGDLTVAECKSKCATLVGCEAIAWMPGKCFRRADVDLAKCEHGTKYTTYVLKEH
jgi:hypothetical protein